MSAKKQIITLLLLILLIPQAYAEDPACGEDTCITPYTPKSQEDQSILPTFQYHANEKVCIVYFYSPTCTHCVNIKPYLKTIEQKYADNIMLERYDVTQPENIALYNKFCTSKNYEDKTIPLIGINEKILTGETQIKTLLEPEILRGIAMEQKICPIEGMHCSITQTQNDTDPLIPELGSELTWTAILPLILFTGLADGINPCAFAVLLFIMAFLLEISNSKKRLIKITIAYITAVFTVNILLGILYYYTSIQLGHPELIRNIAITLALLAGLINIKDYFSYGKGITLKIPESSKTHIQKLTKKATLPSAILLGSLVAILEAPCSIPIYLTVIEVLKTHGQILAQIFPYILIYNIMFILPIIVLALMIYYGGESKPLEKWRDKHKRLMKLMLGSILILLALTMYLGYI